MYSRYEDPTSPPEYYTFDDYFVNAYENLDVLLIDKSGNSIANDACQELIAELFIPGIGLPFLVNAIKDYAESIMDDPEYDPPRWCEVTVVYEGNLDPGKLSQTIDLLKSNFEIMGSADYMDLRDGDRPFDSWAYENDLDEEFMRKEFGDEQVDELISLELPYFGVFTDSFESSTVDYGPE